MSVRVSAPCRLHFGLFHVPVPGLTHWPDGRPVRKFGGVGLMVETPNVTVTVTRSAAQLSTGRLAARADSFLDIIHSHDWWGDDGRYSVTADGPIEHVGLGVGTALGMAVARGVNRVRFGTNGQNGTVKNWADMVERGKRSGIGIHGFLHGGLLFDRGIGDGQQRPQLGDRVNFPTDWRAVLIRPPAESPWYGDTERAVFARNRPTSDALATTDRLHRLAYECVLPAVIEHNFDAFADAIHEFNRVAGEPFAADQGGPYSSMAVSCVIDELLGWGVTGVGQSSWGPTVFAFARDADEAEHIASRARAWLPSDADVTVTAADNHGARVEVL